jgi:ribosomal protein L29
MEIEKKIDDLQDKLRRLESRYSQSNPSDVMEIRSLKREIKKLQTILDEGKESKPTTS